MYSDYELVTKAIRFIDENKLSQPDLGDIAQAVSMSKYHFHRLFQRYAGVSPKKFLQYLTASHARQLLESSQGVLLTSLASGLSGPSRLHDLTVQLLAMTPGQVAEGGRGVVIRYGVHTSPFGRCLVSVTDQGISGLVFVEPGEDASAVENLSREWPHAELIRDTKRTSTVIHHVFSEPAPAPGSPLRVWVRGTRFQVKVWEALLSIPPGCLVSYEEVAQAIGSPTSTRAVANAIGSNPVSVLIPCHRVIRKTGAFGGYRWGLDRKRAIIATEQARFQSIVSRR